ncbi:cell division protein FtsY [Campylobacter blaseri]|uniref:Signal recognition particle receptor FtsY n=1 Tax=Campylobacter blaseri TaxID=2042961 RepID=A0A2P8QZ46_9BACT|nr:signal recognition particle-docking protein FtsY [Campylobacter blaseri]PSM51512.1 signal recognition particle-docking protein FtsY [Campylobacter blaseri]PSM52961.1 signal recognition particle-docking protein FtsY [Campylobacter blaseri]QKF86474.1 cell division protein FtsY [Campylobacter blaseri]
MIDFFKKGFAKTVENIKSVRPKNQKINKDILEDILLEADIDYDIVEDIIFFLPPVQTVKRGDLKTIMSKYFTYDKKEKKDVKPFVELILGVNGAGKTTTIAKLANLYKKENKKVILGACDTFRAGAIEQLKKWALKIDVPIVATNQGHDASAVAYDTISSAIARKFDNVLIDTAGRLQNQKNLAKELEKIVRISDKAMENAPHRKILVIDGTQGNNSVVQAKAFNDIVKLDGIIITKLDGTPKGGALFGIAKELKLPILYIGVGESMDDLVPFNHNDFIDTILEAIFDGQD